MPISAQCKCGRTIRLKDELAGKNIRCPECAGVVAVPDVRMTLSRRDSSKPRRRRQLQHQPDQPEDTDLGDEGHYFPTPRRPKKNRPPSRKIGRLVPVVICLAAIGIIGGAGVVLIPVVVEALKPQPVKLPTPRDLGPIDVGPDFKVSPEWRFSVARFTFFQPEGNVPCNYKQNSVDFAPDTREARAAMGKNRTQFWYEFSGRNGSINDTFTDTWYEAERKRLEAEDLVVISMDEAELMGKRCLQSVIEKNHQSPNPDVPRAYFYGMDFKIICPDGTLKIRFLTTYSPTTTQYESYSAFARCIKENSGTP